MSFAFVVNGVEFRVNRIPGHKCLQLLIEGTGDETIQINVTPEQLNTMGEAFRVLAVKTGYRAGVIEYVSTNEPAIVREPSSSRVTFGSSSVSELTDIVADDRIEAT